MSKGQQLKDIAKVNAETANDQQMEYDDLEACWAAYRDNVEDSAREIGASPREFRYVYSLFDSHFYVLTGWSAWD